jgi:hypothetical protein
VARLGHLHGLHRARFTAKRAGDDFKIIFLKLHLTQHRNDDEAAQRTRKQPRRLGFGQTPKRFAMRRHLAGSEAVAHDPLLKPQDGIQGGRVELAAGLQRTANEAGISVQERLDPHHVVCPVRLTGPDAVIEKTTRHPVGSLIADGHFDVLVFAELRLHREREHVILAAAARHIPRTQPAFQSQAKDDVAARVVGPELDLDILDLVLGRQEAQIVQLAHRVEWNGFLVVNVAGKLEVRGHGADVRHAGVIGDAGDARHGRKAIDD